MRWCALVLLLAAGCGADAGLEAYDAGRFEDAHKAFRAAEDAAGAEATAALSYNRALAGLRAAELRDAAAAVERAAARAGPDLVPQVDFLRGNVAFAQGELAARQAEAAGSEPFAFDIAINHVERALRAWERAAMSRADWPAARRNLERAQRKLAELRRRKAEAEDKRRRESDRRPKPKPKPKPPPPKPEPAPEADQPDGPQLDELSPAEVRRLLDRLAEKEREKLALRRQHRKERMAGVERDW